MKLAIVGSVDLTIQQGRYARRLIEMIISLEGAEQGPAADWMEVVSGGADGIDTIAEDTAEHFVVMTKIFRPDIDQWEDIPAYALGGYRKGFKSRNLEIANYCDVLYSIRSRQSETYGSGWTADRAEELGKRVYRYFV